MGIRKLNKFLSDLDLIKTYHNINEYVYEKKIKNKKFIVCIDFWLYANKFHHSCGGNILIGFWNQIIKFLSHRIIPIYIIDGKVPVEKLDIIKTRKKRREANKNKLNIINDHIDELIKAEEIDEIYLNELNSKKEKLEKSVNKISNEQLNNIFELFDKLNIEYIKANYEADFLCSRLFDNNFVISCLSDDMDLLALGCDSLIKFDKGLIKEFNLTTILNKLSLSHEQFIELCILFGNDYINHSVKMDTDEIYNLLLEKQSIKEIFKSNHSILNTKNRKAKIIYDKYENIKNLYLKSKNKETLIEELSVFDKLNIEEIFLFLENNNFFDNYKKSKNNIKKSLKYINNHIDKGLL